MKKITSFFAALLLGVFCSGQGISVIGNPVDHGGTLSGHRDHGPDLQAGRYGREFHSGSL